ncbi:MAG: glyceraldehyde-3-phosphate dehydrogenase [Salinisphaeraceae bacterium]|nr:glyceraldehyde-3-phosphate dehydrogenase [Salinisphaeraceae bacterium]
MIQANGDGMMANWEEQERAAEAMIPLIGELHRQRAVEISIYGQLMVKKTVNDIMKAHDYSRRVEKVSISPVDTLAVLEDLVKMPLRKAHVDIGKLVVKYMGLESKPESQEFFNAELADALSDDDADLDHARDVVLFGFGRIGRLVARILCERTGGAHGMRLRAVVVRKGKGNDLEKRASLLRFDSVHGPFKGVVDVDAEKEVMIINGQPVQVIYAGSPEEVDYTAYGIEDAVLVDNTGAWRDEEGLGRHLQAKGISKVLLTAPGKGDIKNIVHGINHGAIEDSDKILSAASCTTNAISPVLKSINDKFGIVNGHMETIHSYTNDQNLIDNYHKADRRGRGAPLNMVLTETGATSAVGKALPELAGKLTGSSVRVPTPNVSIAILSLNLEADPDKEELNDHLRYMAMHSELQKQIGYSNVPDAVSTDFVGMRNTGVVDSLATQAGDKRCVVYVWYDNEFGYTCQVVRILRQVTGSTLPVFPKS